MTEKTGEPVTIAIVVVAYNRQKSLARLLRSLATADYEEGAEVPLLICIDGGGSDQCIRLAEEFSWKKGPKRVIVQPHNLGLRQHVLVCGDLAEEYDGILMLEDDLMVSPAFYRIAKDLLHYYQDDPLISGVSLYSHQRDLLNRRPFSPVEDGSDVFFLQIASSWGQAWTRRMWGEFRKWQSALRNNELELVDIPEPIKKWPDSSWLKLYIAYLEVTGKFFVYPRQSFSTNFGDEGTHVTTTDRSFLISFVLSNDFALKLTPVETSPAKYDAYFELTGFDVPPPGETSGQKPIFALTGNRRVSSFCGRPVITYVDSPRSGKWAAILKPIELNVILDVPGTELGILQPAEYGLKKSPSVAEFFILTDRLLTTAELVAQVRWKIKLLWRRVLRRWKRQ